MTTNELRTSGMLRPAGDGQMAGLLDGRWLVLLPDDRWGLYDMEGGEPTTLVEEGRGDPLPYPLDVATFSRGPLPSAYPVRQAG